MVEPEVGHDLPELALGEDGAEELGFGELAEEVVGAAAGAGGHGVEELALAGVELGEEEIALVAGDLGGEGDAVGDGKAEERGHALVFGKCVEVSGDAGGGGLIELLLGGLSVVGEVELGVGGLPVGEGLFFVEVAPVLGDEDLVDGGELRVRGEGALAFGDLLDEAASGEEGEGFSGLEVEGGVVGEALVKGGVGDGVWVELLGQPGVGAGVEEAVEVAGAGTEGKAVEELEGAFAGGERGECGFGSSLGVGLGLALREAGDAGARLDGVWVAGGLGGGVQRGQSGEEGCEY